MKGSAHKVTLTLSIYTTVARVFPFQSCFPSVGCHSIHPSVSATIPPSPPACHRDVWAVSVGVQLGVTFLPPGTSLGSRALGSA